MAKKDKDELEPHPATGIYTVAALAMTNKFATAEQKELAQLVLNAGYPRTPEPREFESVASSFNRHMDAAIDSCNDSAREQTRAARRALLARDLDRADLVLLDRFVFADILERAAGAMEKAASNAIAGGTGYLMTYVEGESFGAECIDGDRVEQDPQVND